MKVETQSESRVASPESRVPSPEPRAFCQPCRARGRPDVPATREVKGEPWCQWCFAGREGPSVADPVPRKSARCGHLPVEQTDPVRAAAIVADYQAGMRLMEICEKHRCSSNTVLRLVRVAHLQERGLRRSPVDDTELGRDYLAGWPYWKLQRKYHLEASSIVWHLRRAGIQPNRQSSASSAPLR